MAAAGERIRNELIVKEELLFNNDIRNDPNRLSDLVDNNCIEILANGTQRIYRHGQLFGNADGELYVVSNSEKMIDLADDCKLLLYTAGKATKNNRMKSSRSSIWKKIEGKWKMIFHQGTEFVE